MEILLAVGIVALIGLIAGLGLSAASAALAVPTDEREESLRAALPGANCGACGFSGCDGYAAALAAGEADPNRCAPGGQDTAAALAELLGVEAGPMKIKAAMVLCGGSREHVSQKFDYQGPPSCAAAAMFFAGTTSCPFGCLGFGDCADACEYDAIEIIDELARVNPLKCTACGRCVKACPKGLLSLLPADLEQVVRCSNKDRGAVTRKQCDVGCIGCMKCTKVCPTDAIHVEENLARIDPDTCIRCGKCAEVCPVKCIQNLCI